MPYALRKRTLATGAALLSSETCEQSRRPDCGWGFP